MYLIASSFFVGLAPRKAWHPSQSNHYIGTLWASTFQLALCIGTWSHKFKYLLLVFVRLVPQKRAKWFGQVMVHVLVINMGNAMILVILILRTIEVVNILVQRLFLVIFAYKHLTKNVTMYVYIHTEIEIKNTWIPMYTTDQVRDPLLFFHADLMAPDRISIIRTVQCV